METRANYVLVGSVVLAAIAAIVVFVLWLAQTGRSQNTETYYTYFTGSVTGLRSGSAVRYRGVPVGNVDKIEIDPANVERIRVTLKLNEGTPVKTDSVASMGLEGITGGAYVLIAGGTQASPKLTAPDDQIPVIKAQNSSLASLEEDAPKLLGKLIDLADHANSALSPENIQAINQMLANLQTASANLAALGPDAKQATAGLNQLIGDLRTQLPRLVNSLEQDGAAARDAANQFRQVASNINGVISENRGPLKDFTGNGLYEVTSLVAELRGLTDTLKRVADRLDRDPQRYLFGGGSQGVNPNRPITAGVPTGDSR